jgi:hypothetical protein
MTHDLVTTAFTLDGYRIVRTLGLVLTGGRAVSGPTAAGVAGNVYKNLDAGNYFAVIASAGQ